MNTIKSRLPLTTVISLLMLVGITTALVIHYTATQNPFALLLASTCILLALITVERVIRNH